MQSLWSRVGQAHRCGCRACDVAVTGLGRRATTAARRRKPTFAEVFTACYSSLFATAAVVDAVRKEDRRQDLDRQLEQARRDVAHLQQLRQFEAARAISRYDADQEHWLTTEQMDYLWRSLKTIYKNRPFMKEIHKPVSHRYSQILAQMKDDFYNCPDTTSMEILRETDYELLERVLYSEEETWASYRSPMTARQLHNDSRTVVHLVKQLLKRVEANDKSCDLSPSLEEARALVNQESHGFTFTSINPGGSKQNMRQLNNQLREIINTPGLSLKEKVGKICYNLLVSPYPPDMHTYNTLIVGFDKTGHKYLAEPLVNSFFYYRRLQPTPSTMVSILHHYKNSNNHGRFLRSLATITGLDSDTGAKIRRRHVDELEMRVISSWANNTKKRTLTGDWIWEHVPFKASLIEAIIDGLLQFKLFDQAAVFFVSSLEAGVTVGTRIIRRLFDECIVALDWRAAVRLIKGFSDTSRNWPVLLLERQDEDSRYLIERLYVLLDICDLRDPKQRPSKTTLENLDICDAKFGQFMRVLERLHSFSQRHVGHSDRNNSFCGANTTLETSKTRLLRIESLWKEQAFVERTLRSIESKLLSPDLSLGVRKSMARHIVSSSTLRSLELNREFVEVAMPYMSTNGSNTVSDEHQHFTESMDSFVADLSKEMELDSLKENEFGSAMQTENADDETFHPEDLAFVGGVTEPQQLMGNGPREMERIDQARQQRILTWPASEQRTQTSSREQWTEVG